MVRLVSRSWAHHRSWQLLKQAEGVIRVKWYMDYSRKPFDYSSKLSLEMNFWEKIPRVIGGVTRVRGASLESRGVVTRVRKEKCLKWRRFRQGSIYTPTRFLRTHSLKSLPFFPKAISIDYSSFLNIYWGKINLSFPLFHHFYSWISYFVLGWNCL